MVQIALRRARRDCLELISDGFELLPVSVLQSIGAERAPRFRKVGTQSCRLAPLALCLLSAALLLECDTQLEMPHGIFGGVLESLLKQLNAFIHFLLPKLNLPLQDQRLRILRSFLQNRVIELVGFVDPLIRDQELNESLSYGQIILMCC